MKTIRMGCAAMALAVLAGCGRSYSGVCEEAAACAGWNEADIDYCVADAEGDALVADEYGCGDEHADLADCRESTGKCEDGDGEDEDEFEFDCDSEEERLDECIDRASADSIDLD
jgi:hypothetical protein